MIEIGKYSFGTGDRFARQGAAQLKATIQAEATGLRLSHIWNKSFREHKTVHSDPASVREEADSAVAELGWQGQYFVDADHINLNNVEAFIPHSDFFTIDVAEYIGQRPGDTELGQFMSDFGNRPSALTIDGIELPMPITQDWLGQFASQFLSPIEAAGKVYRHIAAQKGHDNFVVEVSMDEVDEPQSPMELYFILGGLAREGVPVQTIAPRFTGRFNKGVDYVGNPDKFALEFEQSLYVIRAAIADFGLPANLKLSLHSGSDKFSIYKPINRLLKKHGAGLHVKTAGTTWLEEIGGLAQAGGSGLEFAKSIYVKALERYDELTAPYRTVIDIHPEKLPSAEMVKGWTPWQFSGALRHEPGSPLFSSEFRQLMHVAYKIAAEAGRSFYREIDNHRDLIAGNVTFNLLERHIKPIFIG